MSADKYLSIFSRQMAAIVYLLQHDALCLSGSTEPVYRHSFKEMPFSFLPVVSNHAT